MASEYASSPVEHPALLIAAGHDLRDDLLAQICPGVAVAEEAGDVDEDRIEQLAELVRAGLQQVAVIEIGGGIDHAHPLTDPPSQRGALVAGEIEATRIAHEGEQRLEIAVG